MIKHHLITKGIQWFTWALIHRIFLLRIDVTRLDFKVTCSMFGLGFFSIYQ